MKTIKIVIDEDKISVDTELPKHEIVGALQTVLNFYNVLALKPHVEGMMQDWLKDKEGESK